MELDVWITVRDDRLDVVRVKGFVESTMELDVLLRYGLSLPRDS